MTGHSRSQQAGILIWGKIASFAAEALLPILLIWLLGEPAEVGIFAVIMLVFRFLTMVFTAGFPRAVLYFFSDRTLPEKRSIAKTLTKVLLCLGAGLGVLLILIGTFGHAVALPLAAVADELTGRAGPVDGRLLEALVYLKWLAPYAVFDLAARVLPPILVAEERPRAAAAVPLLRSGLTLIGTLMPVLLGYDIAGIVIGLNISGLIGFIVYAAFMAHLYRGVASVAGTVTVRELFGYALPLGLTTIVSELNSGLDMWLIIGVYLAAAADVAVYRAGSWQIPIVTTVAYSVGSVYMARYKTLHRSGDGETAIRIWRELIGKVGLIVVPTATVFAVSAEEFVAMVFPPEYSGAAPIFRAYCFLTMARVTAYGSMLVAAGRPEDVVKSAVLTLLANLVISLPLVLLLGFVGPAVGTAVAIIPSTAIYCWYIARAYEVRLRDTFPVRDYLGILLIAAIPATLAVAFKLSAGLSAPLMLLVEALIVLVGFAVIATAVGRITAEDRRQIREWATLRVLRVRTEHKAG